MRINGVEIRLPDHTSSVRNKPNRSTVVLIPETLQEEMILIEMKNLLNKYAFDPVKLTELLSKL